MKFLTLTGAVVAILAFSGTAMASTDCTDPVADWQPRDVLRQQLEQKGWEVQRIKVDDGCYEVRGIDRIGNRFKAKYAPASLSIRKLEIKFDSDGNPADYLDRHPDKKTR